MIKKEYMKPTMQVVELQQKCQIFVGVVATGGLICDRTGDEGLRVSLGHQNLSSFAGETVFFLLSGTVPGVKITSFLRFDARIWAQAQMRA